MKPTEIKRLVDQDGKPRCLDCGQIMRFNVPRLGSDGGYVHDETGQFHCLARVPGLRMVTAEGQKGFEREHLAPKALARNGLDWWEDRADLGTGGIRRAAK